MQTFTEPKPFADHPDFAKQRDASRRRLDYRGIDPPLRDLVRGFARLDCCFTLQCCYGHFVHDLQPDKQNTAPLPAAAALSDIDYRMAYLAFCAENDERGRSFVHRLAKLRDIDPEYVQFGSSDWFRKCHPNVFVVQVEPERFQYEDTCRVDFGEALRIERIRNRFFQEIQGLLSILTGGK
jgi:hypothetical protein